MIEAYQIVESNAPWIFTLFAFVIGAVVGSFLNVCIYRIPENRSVIAPGSACACGQPIPFYRNIPIISWILLQGRAACCELKFSIRYPLVELITALLFAACWLQFDPVPALLGMLFCAILLCATFIDLDHMIIPDRFSIGGMVIGVLLACLFPVLHSVESSIPLLASIESGLVAVLGAFVGSGLVYWIAVLGEVIFRKPAMGEGDVKFIGCIGAFCGWQGAVFAMFGGALIGTFVLLPWILALRIRSALKKNVSDVEERLDAAGQVPFGPMLALAAILYYLGLSEYVDAYFNQVAELFSPAAGSAVGR
ncbi:MAG: prepilin peptidase [Coraliomargarita sp. TMED73]|nr:MAG: prepilin peptidase [Coraliomargarita sp. TMED73]